MVRQVRREDLAPEQWAHLDGVLFPLMARLKAVARERRELAGSSGEGGRS